MILAPGYHETAAPEGLRDVVACLWVRVAVAAEEVRVVPDGCVDVVWQQGVGTTVAGPDTTAKLVACVPGDVLVGIRFRPGTGGGALGVPLDRLCDLRVDVADVNRAFAVEADRAPPEVRTRFVTAAAGCRADPLMAIAATRLAHQDIGAVARGLDVSERQLRRRCHAAVGYGPKTLARVVRFRRFVDAIDRGGTDLAALAWEAGYADQSHLTREATRLAGLPPLKLLRARTGG